MTEEQVDAMRRAADRTLAAARRVENILRADALAGLGGITGSVTQAPGERSMLRSAYVEAVIDWRTAFVAEQVLHGCTEQEAHARWAERRNTFGLPE